MNRIRFFLLCLLCCVFTFSVYSSEVTLVRNGKAVSAIVLEKKPTRSAWMAAYELQHVIHLITGVKLPVTHKAPAGVLPIYLGVEKGAKFTGEQYEVRVCKDHIRLGGNDTADYTKVDYANERTFPGTGYNWKTPHHIYNYHSTLLAVYDFLETLCGVRFYSFGDDGTVYRKRSTLSVPECRKRFESPTDATRYSGLNYRDSVRKTTQRERSLLALRWRMNTLYGEVNHTTDSLIWRYWGPARGMEKVFIEKRPQYFIQGYDRMPTGDSAKLYPKNNPPPAQFCPSHPDVAKYFAWEAKEVYDGKAFAKPPLQGVRFRFLKPMEGKDFYYPVQEGDNSYFCKCAVCSKLFSQIKGVDRFSYIHFDFINKVAREAKKLHKDMKIATLAYNMCMERPDPAILKLEDNVGVQLCLGVHSWMLPQIRDRQYRIYKDWVRNEGKKRLLTVWTYILSPDDEARRAYKYNNFPVLFPWKAGKIYQEFMRDGIKGVFLELCTKVNLLEGYVAMRIAFDPSVDPEKIIDEYFHLYYGPAAGEMKAFYKEVERITWDSRNYPAADIASYMKRWGWGSTAMGIHTQKVNWALGTHERMKKLQKIVDSIRAKAKADPLIRKRTEIFLTDVWERAVKGRKEYDQRLEVEKNPLPHYAAAYFGSRTPSDADWSKVRPTASWWELRTRKEIKRSLPEIRLAYTDKEFFVHYKERSSAAMQGKNAELWNNGVELFFGENAAYPFLHIAFGVNGKTVFYRHIFRDGTPVLERQDERRIRVLSNKVTQEGWSFVLAFDRKGTAFATEGAKRFNFIRNLPGRSPEAWSYLEPSYYVAGLFRMGFVHLAKQGKNADFVVVKDFKKRGKWPCWMQNTPSLQKEKAVSMEGKEACLHSASSPVHYMTLISPEIRYGDKIRFDFTVRGSGKGGVGLYFYSSYGKHVVRWHGVTTRFFPVTAEKKSGSVVLDTGKLPAKYFDVLRCRPFLCAEKGAKVWFSDVKFSVVK